MFIINFLRFLHIALVRSRMKKVEAICRKYGVTSEDQDKGQHSFTRAPVACD